MFRDIQETEGRPSLPSEWKEEKDKNKVSWCLTFAKMDVSFGLFNAGPRGRYHMHGRDIILSAVARVR